MIDEKYNNFSDGAYSPKGVGLLKDAMDTGDIQGICDNIYNIFEEPILSERIVAKNIKTVMISEGAVGAMMSGSGPSVFGIFNDELTAKNAIEKIKALWKESIVAELCRPI